MENFSSVNWLAVFVGTVVSFLGCWVWYSPKIFGTKWAEGSGVNLNSDSKPPVFALVTQLIAFFLLATVIGITATTNALFTAILAILSVLVFVVASGAFVNKSAVANTIEGAYVLISGIIMIICQGIF